VPSPTNDFLCPWTRETPDSTICMDRNPPMAEGLTDRQHRAQLKPDDVFMCRACDMSMGLGSASLTMEELVRAYSAFPTGGLLVEPYTIEEVTDREGNVLERHEPIERPRVMDPAVASVATWLLQGVVHGGTAASAGSELGMVGLGGKTGTTNDEKDAWFVGFSNDVIAAVWTGYDQPRTLGVSSTGGRTSLPTWTRYMKVAAPKERDRPFPVSGGLDWASVDEATGRRITGGGGMTYPFLEGTAPESTGLKAGQVSIEDFSGL
jgi:penicillin-binding protein 1A